MSRLTVVAILTMALAVPALAHSKKEATLPADGAELVEAPREIGMDFDMPMRVTLVTLSAASGGEFALERSDDMQPVTQFRAIPGTLAPGKYEVKWRGLAEDGHAMQGSFGFEIAP